MATKDQLYQIIAAYGLGRALPQGSTRRAARAAANAIVKSGKIVIPATAQATRAAAPPLARGAVQLARANPAVATGATLLALQQAGLLDPIIEPTQEFVEEEVVMPIKANVKKRKTNFNKAVSAGMKAVKKSTYMGAKGKLNNAKKAFGKVTKTVSRINKGAKVSAKGVTGTIKRAVKGII